MNKITKWLSRYLKPSQISKLYIILAVIGVLALCVSIMSLTEREKRERREEAEVTNIITSKNSREYGLDAVNSRVNVIKSRLSEANEKLSRVEDENRRLKENTRGSVQLATQLEKALRKIGELESQMKSENQTEEKIKQILKDQETDNQVNEILSKNEQGAASKVKKLTADPKRRPSRNKGFSYGYPDKKDVQPAKNRPITLGRDKPNEPAVAEASHGRSSELFTISENSTDTADNESEREIYVPKGSILTGVLITGLDAPTQSSASENPVPVLIRLKKEAILPNYATIQEVNECFALMAGYGELSTERANLRGESITCVRKDGSVIEKSIGSYAVGEDGKAGLKGTLVTRNSTVLANAMMAGFASGMASMFDVDAVPTISTDSSGNVQYDSVYSDSAIQGGAATGASNAMEKLADYYMTLADAMHPVIEIGSGRVVDMIITKGTTL
jgi:conjugal transfer pilus assembly protein TraB